MDANGEKMSVFRCITIFALYSLLVISVSSPVCAETVIRVGGSGTGTGAMKIVASAFEKKYPGITVRVMPSLGSSGGIKALLGGALDIALSARPLNDQEKAQGGTVVFNARTPFVLMANKSVTKFNMTTGELEAILSGRQLNWGDGKPIRLILRPAGDSDTKLVQAISPEISQAMKSALNRADKNVALTDQDADKDINNISGALGFSTIAQITNEKLSARALKFNGVTPSVKNLKNHSYPLVKELLVVVNQKKATPEILKFIDFLKLRSTANLLEKSGVITSGF